MGLVHDPHSCLVYEKPQQDLKEVGRWGLSVVGIVGISCHPELRESMALLVELDVRGSWVLGKIQMLMVGGARH